MSDTGGRKIGEPFRILLDQNIPRQVRAALAGHEIKTALEMGWDAIANGELLGAAEQAGFSVFVTADQNLQYQQRLTGRQIAILVLTTNHWDIIRREVDKLVTAIGSIQPGGFVTVIFDRPPLRRRRRSTPRTI
jgi:predicted nuclease of predicted toxin-antitoxin system